MLENLQTGIESYLNLISDQPLIRAASVLIIAWLFVWLFDRILIAYVRRLTKKTSGSVDDQIVDLIHKPIYWSLIFVGVASAISAGQFDESVQSIFGSILLTLALLVWSVFLIRLARVVMQRISGNPDRMKVLRPQTLPLFENLVYIAVIALSVYYVFSAWDVDMTAWLASAGIVGIAVGFAAKDTLANLFSGVFILADAPYQIGDFVVLDAGERGQVTHIGIRSTRLLTRDDVEVTVPNSVMGNTKIYNESGGPHEKFRIRVAAGVAYGCDIDRVREILIEVASNTDSVCVTPEPRVRMRGFGASSLDFELLCWIDQPVLRGRVLDQLYCAIYKRFTAENIEIPYTKQDLYIREFPGAMSESEKQ